MDQELYNKLVESRLNDAFHVWFGKSKIILNGKPLVVYHGTNQEFAMFDMSRGGESTQAEPAKAALFFTDSSEVAGLYAAQAARTQVKDAPNHERRIEKYLADIEAAENADDWDTVDKLTVDMEELEYGEMQAEPSGNQIISVYLRIENPYVVDMGGSDNWDSGTLTKAIEKAKSNGNDGVIFKDIKDDPEGRNIVSTHYAVFSGNQVKSVNNKGTWDTGSDDILEQR